MAMTTRVQCGDSEYADEHNGNRSDLFVVGKAVVDALRGCGRQLTALAFSLLPLYCLFPVSFVSAELSSPCNGAAAKTINGKPTPLPILIPHAKH